MSNVEGMIINYNATTNMKRLADCEALCMMFMMSIK